MKANYILVLLASSLLASCSKEEDTTPSYADQAVFAPLDSDMSETARIRRDFYETTGTYLLFTDTLRTVTSGIGFDGKPVEKTELLDVMGYAMIGYGSTTKYIYDYITDPEEQQMAVELIRENLIWRMGKALPYSFFLVNKITHWDSSKKSYVADTKLLGLRAYAISLNDGEAFADPDAYFNNMIADMVRTKVQTMGEEELASFYDISRSYYYEDKTEFGLPATYSSDTEMWNYGFFMDVYGHSFPDSAYDLRAWLTAVITYSREQFEAKYGTSAVMMSKFDALSGIVSDLGYVLQ
ncbi:MAG: hypothetical protein NC206_08020 [Bacteroides sp.]|nr:hypothetical protein [Roseburia sp.]MCM1347015.1 hypothetical protein [Bacteroides sp.]MCM1421534.1 hypothetical protein [Bacteroides sp.]